MKDINLLNISEKLESLTEQLKTIKSNKDDMCGELDSAVYHANKSVQSLKEHVKETAKQSFR